MCVCVWGGGAGEAQAFPGAFSFRSICDYLEIQKIKGLLLSRLNIRVWTFCRDFSRSEADLNEHKF